MRGKGTDQPSCSPGEQRQIPPDPDALLHQLRKSGTRSRAANQKRAQKSAAPFLGVSAPRIRNLTAPARADFRGRRDLAGAVAYARTLWATGIHEPRLAAVMIVGACEPFYDDRVWTLGQGWLREIDNRALCDGIGPDLLAPFVCAGRARHKSKRREVTRWARDENPWVRRGALLCTLRATRRDRESLFLFTVAERLLADPDVLVQKALGGLLRECAHHNPREVITFIQTHRGRMRRSTVTNAVSRLPKTLQRAAREG